MFWTIFIKFLFIHTDRILNDTTLAKGVYNVNDLYFSNPTLEIAELSPVQRNRIVKSSPYYYMYIDLKLKTRTETLLQQDGVLGFLLQMKCKIIMEVTWTTFNFVNSYPSDVNNNM